MHPQWLLTLPILIVASIFFSPLAADDILLKDGIAYHNVKTVPRDNFQFIIFENGTMKKILNDHVQLLVIQDVQWERGLSRRQIERMIAKAVGWEKSRQEKLRKKDTVRMVKKVAKAEMRAKHAEHKAQRIEGAIRGTVWRSALIPGWGQIHRQDQLRGTLFFGTALILVYNYQRSRREFFERQKIYNDQLLPVAMLVGGGMEGSIANMVIYHDRRTRLREAETHTNLHVKALGLLWLANVVDALYFVRVHSSRLANNSAAQIHIGFTENGLQIATNFSF